VGQGAFLDQLLTNTIATLMHQGLVQLEVVAQDGMRVRAHAGSSSFRRKKTLERCQAEAREQVEKLRDESEQEADQTTSNRRRQAARQRAARERQERIEKALEELAKLQAQQAKRGKPTPEEDSPKAARSSTTDPEARKMKMADGGYRPAYNVQFATDGHTRMIVGVEVSNSGSDRGQMPPLHQEVSQNYGQTPGSYLVDCGFATKDDITLIEQRGSQTLAPIHGEEGMRKRGSDPYERKPGDTDEMLAFRQRMATEPAKLLYKQRSSIAEFPNAECRNRGLSQFRVRGLAKVKSVALWHAITFNFMRMIHLKCLG
jgi:hypothetical protein